MSPEKTMRSREKILYIHMGLHKTGSTSLQYFCQSRRAELAERYGVYYPPARGKVNHRHKSLFPASAPVFRKIAEQAEQRNCHAILISNESLGHAGLQDDQLRIIREAAPGFTVKLIFYVRRVDDLCKAWYNERRKAEVLEPRETWAVFMEKSFQRKSHLMFPSRLIQRGMEQVGKENVIVRNYAPHALLNGNIIDDFFSAIFGITLPPRQGPEKLFNVSPPHAALPYFTPSVFSSSRNGYLEMQISRKLRRAFSYPGPGQVRREIEEEVAAEVERLDSLYLKGYKASFAERPLNVQFPELEADPYRIYVAEMLHTLYRRVTWPERAAWRVGVFFYHLLNNIQALQKLLQRFVPGAVKEK